MGRTLAVLGDVFSAVGLVLALPFAIIALALPVVLLVRLVLFLSGQG